MISPTEYLKQKKWGYKLEGNDQARVNACPFCLGRDDFTINLYTGAYLCFKCGERGSLYRLMRHEGDLEEPSLESSSPMNGHQQFSTVVNYEHLTELALRYETQLYQRKHRQHRLRIEKELPISQETRDLHRIGLDVNRDGPWMTIPHYKGKYVVNIEYRSIFPLKKDLRRTKGAESIIFNQNIMKDYRRVILCEGAKDCLMLIDQGFPAVATVTGALTKMTESHLKLFAHLKTIFIAYDTDCQGEEGSEVVAGQLGMHRCKRLSVAPHKDVLDFFRAEKKARKGFTKLLKKARSFGEESIVTLEQALYLALRKKVAYGPAQIITPWKCVNRVVRGWDAGELVVWGAPRKTGKTAICTQIALWQATARQVPSLVYCKEMRSYRIASRIVQAVRGIDPYEIDPMDYVSVGREFRSVPFYLAENISTKTFDQDAAVIKSAVQRLHLQLVVYDNLHYVARNTAHRTEEIGTLMKAFKGLADELGIVLFLICHPRKLNSDRIMKSDDLKDSGSIGDDADSIIVLHRERGRGVDAAPSNETLLRVADSRFGPVGDCTLEFIPGRMTFIEPYQNGH